MKIGKNHILTAILISSLALGINPTQAKMPPEASMLYQQACTAEREQDLKEAISKLEQALKISGGDIKIYTKLAGIYTETDQLDKAIEAYHKVLELYSVEDPNSAMIYISIGSIYETQNKYNEALEAYNKALNIYPENKYNYYNLGNVYYQLKNYKEAIKYYNLFLEKEVYSGHIDARENLAASYIAIKDYENAKKQYEILYNKNSNSGLFKDYANYGIALLNTNNPEKAVEMLEKAIVLDADNNMAHLGLAQAYQDLGKNEDSYEQYQVVLKNIPNLNTVRLDYADLLANMDKNTEAIEQYNMYIKAFPNDNKGYSGIAYVYKKLKNYEKAIENYNIALAKDKDNVDLKKNLANCYHNVKNYDSALKYYDEILEVSPNDYNIKFNKALALHALKQYDEAIELYRELLSTKHEKTVKENLNNALVSRGHELIDADDCETAISYFKEAIKSGYNDGFVYYGLAKAYRKTGDNTKAAENYEKAISIDPDKSLYSNEYGEFISSLYQTKINVDEITTDSKDLHSINITSDETEAKTPEEKPVEEIKTEHVEEQQISPIAKQKNEDFISEGDKNFKSNNFDAAIKNYQDALQLMPNDAVTLLKIGNCYQIKEDNSKAMNFYQKAIIVNPDYTDGWFNLGLAYANENNPVESQKSFEKVIELDSDYNFGYAYYALGIAFENQGKKQDAIKNYKLFIKHNNDKEMINTVQDKIKQLQ